MATKRPIWVIGGGLAGSEAALQLARRHHPVRLVEMKRKRRTPAQESDGLAELVCSNSFRGSGIENAVGAIKEEMRLVGGALIELAHQTAVPAGGALAVDRSRFSEAVEQAIRHSPYIELVEEEVTSIPSADEVEAVLVCTGPLTSPDLSQAIEALCGERLYFYDAIAPIVAGESVDQNIAFRASRYGKGDDNAYLNLPLSEEDYNCFHQAVLEAEKVVPRDFEDAKYFEGCLPIEVMASRGFETLRYGCMKPVGLPDPKTGKEPFAVVQLRPEDIHHQAYNMVGFQTRMKWGSQKEVFGRLPGLAQVEFLRMGSIHRNTYIESPRLLDGEFRLRSQPHIIFAGQITGVEGYVESMASGLLASRFLSARLRGERLSPPPPESTLGALHRHVLGEARTESSKSAGHVPSNIHWGLTPPLGVRAKKRDRKRLMGERAIAACRRWHEG